jgi:hypothetical protein
VRLVLISSPSGSWRRQAQRAAPAGELPSVRFELPASLEMQERAGLIVSGTFLGQETRPSWIAKPSEGWIRVLLRDGSGKLLIDRQLGPSPTSRSSAVASPVVYQKLSFPFEVLSRCEPLAPGRYRLEIRYNSPGSNEAAPVSHSAVVPLSVRSDSAVPLRQLTLQVPPRIVHEDFRVPSFGLPVRVVNDGCEKQEIVPFTPASVLVQVQTAEGRTVSCQPPSAASSPTPISLRPTESWQIILPLSERCSIPLPAGAGERARYRVQVSYRGVGWTDAPLRLNHKVELELANLPHSSPGGLSPGTSVPGLRGRF